jgi:hypothetical protein
MEIKRRENRCLLTIKKADYDDAGIYMCKVEGDQTQTELIVKGKLLLEIELSRRHHLLSHKWENI